MNLRGGAGYHSVRGILGIAVIVFGLFCVPVSKASGQGYVFGRADYPSINTPVAVVTGDFNGDGRMDLAIANFGATSLHGNTVTVYLGQPDGTFRLAPGGVITTGNSPLSIAVGDFNGDGKPDLAVANWTDNTVSILLGNGDGTFQPHVDYATGTEPASVAVGDFNGDGRLDLAVAAEKSNTVSILLGNGDGTFQSHVDYPTLSFPYSVVVADFNGDGKADLAIGSFDGVCTLLGNGDGTFQSYVASGGLSRNYLNLAVGDLNGDGKPDLAAASTGGTLEILFGKGDGTFQTAVGYPIGNEISQAVVIGDFNGDGKPDIAMTDYSGFAIGNTISVVLGNGDGTFGPSQRYNAGVGPAGIAAGDFNRDGHLDLVVTNSGTLSATGYSISVLLGNGDGTFATPSRSFATGSGPIQAVKADFNGDGITDLAVTNSDQTISILLGNGDGSFQTQKQISTGLSIGHILVADFNGDGKPDLGVWNSDSLGAAPIFEVLLGNGDGTFQPPVSSTLPDFPAGLTAGDFNGDGKADLAFPPGELTDTVLIWLGNGDGTFTPGKTYTLPGTAGPLTTSDVNGDGKLDLIATSTNLPPSPSNSVSVFFGNGDGSFQPPTTYNLGASDGTSFVLAADLTGDGKPDIIADMSVLVNNGSGGFTATSGLPDFFSPAPDAAAAVGDLNGDGKADLVLTESYGSTVLLLGNGDGTFQNSAFNTDFLTGPNTASPIIADFNGDGHADLAVVNGSSNSVSIFLSSPVAAFDPGRLNFSNQAVGMPSATRIVTLYNSGNAALRISGVGATGDFSETSTCSGMLAVGANCAVNVTFTPTAIGSRTGTLIFTDSAATSPQVVPLAGTSTMPTVGLSATTLAFGNQSVGSSSSAQRIIISNEGKTSLNITSIATTTDFAQVNTCGSSVAAGASCTISVTFTPTGVGSQTGTLTITDNGSNSPQTVALTGTGTEAVVSLSATSLDFGSELVGGTSGAQTVALKNTGTAALTITSITASGDFTAGSSCRSSVAASASCAISITFNPTAGGSRTGTLAIADGAAGSPQNVALSGSGEDFSFAPGTGSTTTASVSPGGTATYTLSVGALGGLNQAVSFSCTGAPAEATCSVSPSSVTPGNTATRVTVTVTTTEASMLAPWVLPATGGNGELKLVLGLGALCLMSMGWMGWLARRRPRPRSVLFRQGVIMFSVLLLLALGIAACGGGGGGGLGGGVANPGTPAGTYDLKVMGTVTSGSVTVSHTVDLTLQVQ